MKTIITEAAKDWSAEHPWFVEAATRLEENGVTSAVFSSVVCEIARRALDLPPRRTPGDIDLLVLGEDFECTARTLGASMMVNQVACRTGDGRFAAMYAREAIARVGCDEVQFMYPLEPMLVGGTQYHTAYTPEAAAARLVIETGEGLLPLAHPADTIGMYGILQRTEGKHDLEGAAILLAVNNTFIDPYTHERARTMGWDERVQNFVARASLLASDITAPTAQRLRMPSELLIAR